MLLTIEPASLWVMRHARSIRPGGQVLDLACGYGRNARWLARQGNFVTAVDKNAGALESLQEEGRITPLVADLENMPWPFAVEAFDAIIVCRYLHRPLFPLIAASLAPGGVLLYETFMLGQAQYGRPSNPDFLLQADELLHAFVPQLQVMAFEQGKMWEPKPAFLQRICAKK